MSFFRIGALGLALGALALSACSQKQCDPASCGGCCDSSGACQIGNSSSACGTGGLACAVCSASQRCENRQCTGGSGGGGGTSFDYVTLDPATSEPTYLAMAVGPGDRVGVAYFASLSGGRDAGLADGGIEFARDFEVRYVEWNGGQPSAPEPVRTVQRVYGVSVAFQGSGEPAVAYLGGGADQSAYWFQSDAVVSFRSGGTWTERLVAARGNEVSCGNPVSDRGFLVGLFPALVFDGAKGYLAYRDTHDGQFPQQDWNGSDLELAEGGPTSWTKACLQAGGNDKRAYGGHTVMVMADGQPALVHDRIVGAADGPGQDAIFLKRKSDGTWTTPVSIGIASTQSGPSLAWDSVAGFGIAVVERAENALKFTSSQDGVDWTVLDPVYQSGTGGWYPSLAFDPVHHEPAIAFYSCSPRSGQSEGSCLSSEDELRVTQRIGGDWRETVVDSEGGYLPKLGFLSTGKKVVAYRLPGTGAVRLAVER